MNIRLAGAAIFVLAALAASPAYASDTVGTVSLDHPYAWGEDLGWINFAPSQNGSYAGLVITDTGVTGYAWSSAYGWINFSPTNSGQGVTNTPDGQLGGSAWVENLGWIDMSGVVINDSGKFTGIAGIEASSTGRISFDCDRCDVETDWRPASARTQTGEQPAADSNGSPVAPSIQTPAPVVPLPVIPITTNPASSHVQSDAAPDSALSTPPSGVADPIAEFYQAVGLAIPGFRQDPSHVESYDEPLLVPPNRDGLLVESFAGGFGGAIEIPSGAAAQAITVSIAAHAVPTGTYGTSVRVMGEAVFDVTATDAQGNAVHVFELPLKITLLIPAYLQGKNDLGVYWYDTTTQAWIAVPGAVFSGDTVSFTVNHLTRFAVLETVPNTPQREIAAFFASGSDAYLAAAACILLFIGIAAYVRRRSRSSNSR